jgi:hypothetical protein
MGILETPEAEKTPVATKRMSSGPDFSKLGPLTKFGTVGFSGYRDKAASKRKSKGKTGDEDAMDSDIEDNDDGPGVELDEDVDVKQENGKMLSPEDARRQGEIADGVQKIKARSLVYNDYMTLIQTNSLLAQATALWGTHGRCFR